MWKTTSKAVLSTGFPSPRQGCSKEQPFPVACEELQMCPLVCEDLAETEIRLSGRFSPSIYLKSSTQNLSAQKGREIL